PVGRRRLAGEEERPWDHFDLGVFPQAVVQNDDAQRVQKLPFVLVDGLNLAVEDAVRVDRQAARRVKPVGELHLRLALGLAERVAKASVVCEWSEPSQLGEV